MVKIMFVCLGNICRSPMAEFIMKDIVKKEGLEDGFFISSAATGTDEINADGSGNPVYPPARSELKKHGISCEGKTAVQLKKSDYAKYDIFVGMDSSNIRDINRIFGTDPEGKIHKLCEYSQSGEDIADPWFYGNFDKTYDAVLTGCMGLLRYLTNQRS